MSQDACPKCLDRLKVIIGKNELEMKSHAVEFIYKEANPNDERLIRAQEICKENFLVPDAKDPPSVNLRPEE